jgi:phytoene dehydrogenase-like protein
MEEFDFIIIGAGHNGLTCGAYLAKAGEKVLVLEKRSSVGGGATTEEVTLPGFRHNLHSIAHSWVLTGPVYKDLELEKYGARYIIPEIQYGILFPDGKSLILYLDKEKTAKEIEKFSKRDALTYRDMVKKYERLNDTIVRLFYNPPVLLSKMMSLLERTEEGLELLRIQFSNPKNLCDEYFESEEVKTWLLLWAVQSGTPIDYYGCGSIIPIISSLIYKNPYGICIGGSKGLTDAMARVIEAHNGKILLGSEVERIIVDNDIASGVELKKGDKVIARKGVVSGTNFKDTFLKLINEDKLDSNFIKKVKRFREDEVSLITLSLALNEPPKWRSMDEKLNKCLIVGWGCEGVKDIQKQFNEIRIGISPETISGISITPTLYDPTQAPAGKHTMTIWHITTYNIEGGGNKWDEIKHTIGDRIIDKFIQYSPNMKDNILDIYIYSPLDMEREMGSMFKGSIFLGNVAQDQMGIFRPIPGYSNYKTPIINLYLCGGSSHPCGGISGAPGYNAANVIADDKKIKKWWTHKEIRG